MLNLQLLHAPPWLSWKHDVLRLLPLVPTPYHHPGTPIELEYDFDFGDGTELPQGWCVLLVGRSSRSSICGECR